MSVKLDLFQMRPAHNKIFIVIRRDCTQEPFVQIIKITPTKKKQIKTTKETLMLI